MRGSLVHRAVFSQHGENRAYICLVPWPLGAYSFAKGNPCRRFNSFHLRLPCASFSALPVLAGVRRPRGHGPKHGEDPVTLVEYLRAAAVKLDCYFTIEEMHQDVDNWIEAHHVQAGSEPSSIEKMVEDLSSQLKGVHIYRSKENAAVVHIIDERLEKEKDYAVVKCCCCQIPRYARGSGDSLKH